MGAARPVTAGMRTLRGLSGTLAGGLVALAIAVCAAQWLAGTAGRPGPGMAAVVGHAAAALASGSVLVIAAGVLWFGWWA